MNRHFVVPLAVSLFCAVAARDNQMAGSQKQDSTRQAAAHANSTARRVDTSAWKTYRNEKHGFEVKYPETWSVKVGTGSGVDMITIGKPPNLDHSKATVNLGVQENQNPKRLSIEEWAAEQMKSLKIAPESSRHVTFGGQHAVVIENTDSDGKRSDSIFTLLRQTDVLSLSYYPQAEFDATYAAIVDSFRALK